MILGKKLIVIMPAYNAEKTLRQTYEELPHEYVDEVILVDDASKTRLREWPVNWASRRSSIREIRGMEETRRPAIPKHSSMAQISS